MQAAGPFGALIGVVLAVTSNLPQPAGSAIFWSLCGVQMVRGAVQCWRRTGLAFATAAMVHGGVVSLTLVVLAFLGEPFLDQAPASLVWFVGVAGVGPLFLLIESRVNADKWQAWRRHMETVTAWDILALRHYPELRPRT